MSIKGVRCPLGDVLMAEHEKCMLTPNRPCGLTPDLLGMITGSEKERVGIKFSPSSIQGCQRREILQKGKDWFVDVDQAWPSVRGNLIHAIFEGSKPWPGILGTVREHRFETVLETKHGPQTLSAKPDVIVLNRIEGDTLFIHVIDYKSKSEIGHDLIEADKKHQNQINMYAWVASRELVEYLRKPLVQRPLNYDDPAINLTQQGERELVCLYMDYENPKVVVERVEIEYMDMKKVRTFVSGVTRYARGKMTKRTAPKEYETLTLAPLPLHKPASVQRWVTKKIEAILDEQVGGQVPHPLVGEDAWVCYYCPVRSSCIEVGRAEGLDMVDQEKYK